MSIIYQGGETKKWDQGQYTFAIRQFPPFHAMKVLGELQKVLAPALGGAIGGIKPETLDQDTNNVIFIGNTVADALNGLARSMDGDTLEKVSAMLLDPDYVSVAPLHTKDFQQLDESAVNEVYSGRIFDMIVLMVQVFKINYLDFSKLSSVPTGVIGTLRGLKQSFQANVPKSSRK